MVFIEDDHEDRARSYLRGAGLVRADVGGTEGFSS